MFRPGGRPKASPMAARTDGANCATLTRLLSLSFSNSSCVWFFSTKAAVGQTLMHWPQVVQTLSANGMLYAGMTTVLKPR